MKRFPTVAFGAFVLVASLTFGQTPAEKTSAKPEVVKTQAKTRGAAAANSNIKSADTANDAKQKTPPPMRKSGTRGAGPYECGIHVDNRTAWMIQIYLDGKYAGTVNTWGDVAGITGNGATTLYGIAHFSNASDREWGPQVFDCAPGKVFTWTLTD